MQKDVLSYHDYIEQGGLGRHETFTPRFGWLKKGYDAVKKDAAIFKAEDAIERLGVGKNMVRAIRFWCMAFNIIEPGQEDKSLMVTTRFGDELLADDGWDPYLEDYASLWLLHWQLFLPPLEIVNWSNAFNRGNVWDFNKKELSDILYAEGKKYTRLATISRNSFDRDASCLIRMYAKESAETEINCPFSQLGLIYEAEEKHRVTFNNSEKTTLPILVFLATCCTYMSFYMSKRQRTVSLQKLSYGFNSPGVVFKVSKSVVGAYLYSATKNLKKADLRDNMGTYQLYLHVDPEELYWTSLKKYYEEKC